ncbi:MAG: hypothetical protein IT260_11000 [Saprospiraceae bacterium]|nr:hypothetical protein [Saprospiraceae bacterium]
MIKRMIAVCSSCFFLGQLSAQMERTVYQVFEVDSIQNISLDIVGFTYPELHVWAGNSIMTEANIQVWEAAPEVVNELIKQGRYAFESEKTGDLLRVFTKVRKREDFKLPGMKTKCVEQTTVKVFIPDIYEWDPAEWTPEQIDKPKTLRRKPNTN